MPVLCYRDWWLHFTCLVSLCSVWLDALFTGCRPMPSASELSSHMTGHVTNLALSDTKLWNHSWSCLNNLKIASMSAFLCPTRFFDRPLVTIAGSDDFVFVFFLCSKNGGTCIDGVRSYSCNCPQGTLGDFCEQGKENGILTQTSVTFPTQEA